MRTSASLLPLSDIELEAVFDVFVGLTTFALPGDEARYAEGLIDVGGRAIRVVACAAPEMGNSAAAMISTKVISKFRPHVSFMAGVCAGIDANIGDIAVAEHALHYESGKWTEGTGGEAVFLPQPRYLGGGNAIIGRDSAVQTGPFGRDHEPACKVAGGNKRRLHQKLSSARLRPVRPWSRIGQLLTT